MDVKSANSVIARLNYVLPVVVFVGAIHNTVREEKLS